MQSRAAGRAAIEPSPAEAAIVRLIFDWAVAGMSTSEITQRLCANAIPTRADSNRAMTKTNAVGVWNTSTVTKILHQQTYIGVWHYGKTQTVRIDGKVRLGKRQAAEQIPIAVPAIVTTSVFDAAQAALGSTTCRQVGAFNATFESAAWPPVLYMRANV
jgi:hypothetical protein